jgi:hypothetical protein
VDTDRNLLFGELALQLDYKKLVTDLEAATRPKDRKEP